MGNNWKKHKEKLLKSNKYINDILDYITTEWYGFKLKEDKDFEYRVLLKETFPIKTPIFIVNYKDENIEEILNGARFKNYYLSLFPNVVIDLNVGVKYKPAETNILSFNFAYYTNIMKIWASKWMDIEKFFNNLIYDDKIKYEMLEEINIYLNKLNKKLKGYIYISPQQGRHGPRIKLYNISKTNCVTITLSDNPKVIGDINKVDKNTLNYLMKNVDKIKSAVQKIWKKSPTIKEINEAIIELKNVLKKF